MHPNVQFVQPATFLIGATGILGDGLYDYLHTTGNEVFTLAIEEAKAQGLSDGECLVSLYAKLCYASLTEGHNNNISRTRSIKDNLMATMDAAHGSVFEHCWLNFVTTDCSRVFTHEMVRHRAGTAFSQTSGRYVRTDYLKFVHDPILDDVKDEIQLLLEQIRTSYQLMEIKLGLREYDASTAIGARYGNVPPVTDMDRKKKLTSALRRILPNGQANEIGWSINLRALRHLLMLRTSTAAEWEIRQIFWHVFQLISMKFPLMVRDAMITHKTLKTGAGSGEPVEVDPIGEITGMRMQPYDRQVEE